MSAQNEDFLFAQEAVALSLVTDAQVQEAFLLQKRMADDLKLDERVSVILVKRGYLAEDQARRVQAKIQPERGAPGEIQGYRLLEVIGRGAMGTVYRAVHVGLNRVVALKILRQDLAGDRTQVERLKAEAGMLASLDHPNIVRALDAGESNGFPYVVMEYVEGETLRDRLRREGRLSEAEALRIARCVADALERARRMGVVHRDVKPGNILLSKAGVPKLMDLGLAKGPIDLGLTQHGSTVGTPQYIAPEQAVDPRKADTRSDIYGLGATLYAMLTGQPPFDGQTLAEILTKVLYQSPTPLKVLRPDVSTEAGYLVERMMLRDPVLRYRTPALVVQDIDRLVQGTSILPAGFQGNWEAYLVRKQARGWFLVAGGAVAAAVLVAFGVREIVRHTRLVEDRALAYDRIAGFVAQPLTPHDTLERLKRLQGEGRAVEAEAASLEPTNLSDLRRRLSSVEAEVSWFASVTEAEGPASEAADAGDFARAERLWIDVLQKVAVSGAARTAATDRLATVRSRSALALADAHREEFARAPDTMKGVVDALSAWRDALATRFAQTQECRLKATAATVALDAAREVAANLARILDAHGSPAIFARIDRLELAPLRRDLKEARAEAENGLDAALASITRGEFYSEAHLRRIVTEPFDGLDRDAAEQVAQRFRLHVAPEADRRVAEGRSAEAIDLLDAFARAAEEDGAYPDLAREARSQKEGIAVKTQREREAAGTAFDALVGAVVSDLFAGAGDAAAARTRLDAAAKEEALYRPLAGRLALLRRVPDLVDAFWRRVLDGVEAHRGDDKSLWIPTVEMRDGTVDKGWLVKSVDRDRRAVTFVSHRGGFPGNPQVKTLDALSDAELDRLAGLRDGVPGDELLRGIHALWGLKPAEAVPDFYTRQSALAAVREAFHRGGDDDGPLVTWLVARLAAVEAEVAARELEAKNHWETGQGEMTLNQYSEARYHFARLLEAPWRYAKLVRAREHEIEAVIRVIDEQMNLDRLQKIQPGVKVTRKADGDVEVLYSFNTREQLENLAAGYVRLVPPGPGRVVTPDPDPNDMALELLPGLEGQVVTDRPLAIEACLDPQQPRSIEFDLWPMTPTFLAVDLDGLQSGILSMDPQLTGFPPDVPKLDGEKTAPKSDPYGRGRGIVFRAAPDLGDPTSWPWDDGVQGRHFVPPESPKPRVKDFLQSRWFAFEPGHAKPYHVKLTWLPSKDTGTLILNVDQQDRATDTGPQYRSPKPSGFYQILTWSTCLVDNVRISGRLSEEWLNKKEGKGPTGTVKPAAAPVKPATPAGK